MTAEQIEKFLESNFEGFYYADGDPTFRNWIGQVLATVDEIKRAPGCDSDWSYFWALGLAQLNPKIADPALVDRMIQAERDEDWDLADSLHKQIEIDYEAAEVAWSKVIAHLLAPR